MRCKLIAVIAALLCTTAVNATTTAVSIEYGRVVAVRSVQKQAHHTGGALVGGIMGALIGSTWNRNVGAAVGAAGAAIGAGVQGAKSHGMALQYTVRLTTGGEAVVTTEQEDLRPGDCVAVERGQYANMRRVAAINCEDPPKTPPPHHLSSAYDCQLAKAELTKAATEEAVNLAIKKVHTLCED